MALLDRILARMQQETDYTTDDLEYVLDPMEVSVLRDVSTAHTSLLRTSGCTKLTFESCDACAVTPLLVQPVMENKPGRRMGEGQTCGHETHD